LAQRHLKIVNVFDKQVDELGLNMNLVWKGMGKHGRETHSGIV